MDLIKQWEIIKKKKRVGSYPPGYVFNIFEINDKNGKDYLGNPVSYVKVEPEQKKKVLTN